MSVLVIIRRKKPPRAAAAETSARSGLPRCECSPVWFMCSSSALGFPTGHALSARGLLQLYVLFNHEGSGLNFKENFREFLGCSACRLDTQYHIKSGRTMGRIHKQLFAS